jgi:hypothetical protein
MSTLFRSCWPNGADPLWRDVDGDTAMDIAKKSEHLVAVELIEKFLSRGD